MKVIINLPIIYHKINPKISYYMYKTGEIVGYKKTYKKQRVAIIQFYDLTRVWILENELKDFKNKDINKNAIFS